MNVLELDLSERDLLAQLPALSQWEGGPTNPIQPPNYRLTLRSAFQRLMERRRP